VTPNPKPPPNSTFCVDFHIFVVGEHGDFTFGVHVQVPAYGRQVVLETGVVTSRDPFLIFSPHKISLEQLKIETSNFVHCFLPREVLAFRLTNNLLSGCDHGHVTSLFLANNRLYLETVQYRDDVTTGH